MEDALGRLDQLTREEVRMAAAQSLKATHEVDNKVQVVDRKVQSIDDHVQQVDGKVEGVGNRVQQVASEIDHQKRSSSYRIMSFLMNSNSSYRDTVTKGPQKLALSPRSICKLQYYKRCSSRRYRLVVHGEQRFQRLEGVQFIAVDLRKTCVSFLPLPVWLRPSSL
jgi:hypothetical protein